LTQIKGQTLNILWVFPSDQNFYHRKFLDTVHDGNPPHDGFITQWVFPFLPLQPSRILSTDSHPATDRDCGSPHIVGFSFFTTNHTNLNGSTRWGSPFRPPPQAQSLILTVHGLGLIPQRHTHGSEFLPLVQRLVQELNVYKLLKPLGCDSHNGT